MVTRPVKDAHHVDLICIDSVENLVVAVHPPPDAFCLVARHKRMAQRHGGEAGAFVSKLSDEGTRTGRVILCDVVADCDQVVPGLGGKANLHAVSFSAAP